MITSAFHTECRILRNPLQHILFIVHTLKLSHTIWARKARNVGTRTAVRGARAHLLAGLAAIWRKTGVLFLRRGEWIMARWLWCGGRQATEEGNLPPAEELEPAH